ncbi:hypothetical protein CAP36_06005 [Chitinophagaceae bacterium IBVUCB2]|nr:hypothetical protein CAP36_06005 [Chitinophagaceae bacterium IBVUCB2]
MFLVFGAGGFILLKVLLAIWKSRITRPENQQPATSFKNSFLNSPFVLLLPALSGPLTKKQQ